MNPMGMTYQKHFLIGIIIFFQNQNDCFEGEIDQSQLFQKLSESYLFNPTQTPMTIVYIYIYIQCIYTSQVYIYFISVFSALSDH